MHGPSVLVLAVLSPRGGVSCSCSGSCQRRSPTSSLTSQAQRRACIAVWFHVQQAQSVSASVAAREKEGIWQEL